MGNQNEIVNVAGASNPAAEWVVDAQDLTDQEHSLNLFQALKLYPKAVFWSMVMSTAIIMDGYDTMLMGNLLAQPAFQKHYGIPAKAGKYEIPAAWQSGLNQGSACGQIIGLLAAGYISEYIGFRKTMSIGLLATIALIFIPFFAPSLAVLEVGQVIFGIPLGLFQTVPVVYAMEVSPMCLRPYLTTYINFCWAIGHLIGSGILRGSLSISGEWGFRVPFAIQWVWPVVLLPLIFFAPESPWWLVRKGRMEEAGNELKRLTSARNEGFDIQKNINLIAFTIEHERALSSETSYMACFKGTDLKRTLIGIGIYCIQTLSGNPLRGYSTYFMEEAGLASTMSFDMTIVNYSLALLGSFFSWVLLPIYGRRSIYFWSLVMMFVLMILIGALGVPQAKSDNSSYSWAIGAILIISSFLYNCSMGPLTNTLCAEIPTALLRSKSIVLARATYSVSTIVAGILTTYQLNSTAWNWGAKTGFFWAGGCLISAIFAYFFVPESKNRTVAEMDILFEKKVSLRHFAETRVDLTTATEKTEQN
ncbi:hypothetical protein N7495_003506 [Penicillium taxi]|uniref:uncharacterized protein n=1 Tax=Penicillium taxi TaxID=168475 RepID=UPI0025455E94|nr:uncharacterized protein N7495_003506 [Penicillium taxi]KAJ5898762.1 hypothetical protein N7495_003506 [Penicillium taxi]